MKNRTLLIHMAHGLTINASQIWDWVKTAWFTETGSFVLRIFSLLARLAVLASVAMDDSMEWLPPFEEIELVS